ncbi:SigE family RNA polymerase sigma factor [Umezawaea beigongshangensis]|uniref:SigE family RNA polymerase sigma factor n=1 Tax=Umezawaea beigongshangensis TaxID=2780383 RepID=UPI0027DD99B6|nr:SigE family RNA polymerase sigma factor [Umezawaea beigongshangensis]
MPTSYTEFVETRFGELSRYATALTGDPHLAQDVVQDVLIRLRPRWGSIDAPGPYVRRMITNEYFSWRRRRSVRDVVLSPPDVLTDIGPATGDFSAQIDERDAMMARLSTLPRKQRAAVVLRYYENCDDAEIAAVLGCRTSTVRSQISRALATLREVERTGGLVAGREGTA